jgi:hypothetical protein
MGFWEIVLAKTVAFFVSGLLLFLILLVTLPLFVRLNDLADEIEDWVCSRRREREKRDR